MPVGFCTYFFRRQARVSLPIVRFSPSLFTGSGVSPIKKAELFLIRFASLVGAPDKIAVPFDHDWVGLEDDALPGHRYADEKWHDTIPSMFSVGNPKTMNAPS